MSSTEIGARYVATRGGEVSTRGCGWPFRGGFPVFWGPEALEARARAWV
jgi:hypothetical protein